MKLLKKKAQCFISVKTIEIIADSISLISCGEVIDCECHLKLLVGFALTTY